MSNPIILSCKNISISRNEKVILREISFDISPGEIIVLLGSNGSGKSTLLKTIANILPFQKGNIILQEKDILAFQKKQLCQLVSYTAQQNDFELSYSVYDFVSLGRYPHKGIIPIFTRLDKDIIENALVTTNLVSLKEKRISQISGGEQQRAVLARALTTEAPLMLLDEPTSSLDIKHQLELFQILKTLKIAGKTIIIALHDINDAIEIADKIILLHQGTIAFNGSSNDPQFRKKLEDTFQIKMTNKSKFEFHL